MTVTEPRPDADLRDARDAIRPFRVEVPQADLDDLHRRLRETRWPEHETVGDSSQGVQLEVVQELAKHWVDGHDWRAVEARLNDLPQFVTEIDGLDIHFIHVRSEHEDALPMIVTHGWPGSVIEQLKIVGPLTDPTAHGASAADAFHLVIPSLPGHGFSGKPEATGWDPIRIARAWIELMRRLGYDRYVAQGGDWGNAVTEQMALLTPPGSSRGWSPACSCGCRSAPAGSAAPSARSPRCPSPRPVRRTGRSRAGASARPRRIRT